MKWLGGAIIDDFEFFELFAHSLELAHVIPTVKLNGVWTEFSLVSKLVGDGDSKFFLSDVHCDQMDVDFIEPERVIIFLSKLSLPGSHAIGVVECVFECVKVDECAFYFT